MTCGVSISLCGDTLAGVPFFLRAEVTRAPSPREIGNGYYATFGQGANGVTGFFRRTQVIDGALQSAYDANCVIRPTVDSNFELSYSV